MTPEAIEPHLPHVPAGISSGDLTEPDDRMEFAVRLAKIYGEVERAQAAARPSYYLRPDDGAWGEDCDGHHCRHWSSDHPCCHCGVKPVLPYVEPVDDLDRFIAEQTISDPGFAAAYRRAEDRAARTRHPLRPRHGDTWAQRQIDGRYRTVIVATNDWPPPDPLAEGRRLAAVVAEGKYTVERSDWPPPDPRWRIELEGAA